MRQILDDLQLNPPKQYKTEEEKKIKLSDYKNSIRFPGLWIVVPVLLVVLT